jgi:hypothetical protein
VSLLPPKLDPFNLNCPVRLATQKLSRLSVVGYTEFHPVSPNSTPEGRARNRRVDIVILNPPQPERVEPDVSPAPAVVPAAKGTTPSASP